MEIYLEKCLQQTTDQVRPASLVQFWVGLLGPGEKFKLQCNSKG